MIRNNLYLLTEFYNEKCLIPTGQALVDQKSGVRLNESGEFIWNILKDEVSTEQLIHKVIENYRPERKEIENVTEDVISFLNTMSMKGLILGFSSPSSRPGHNNFTIDVAGIKMALPDDEDFIHESLKSFGCARVKKPDIRIWIRLGLPTLTENGTVILRNDELIILKSSREYVIIYLKAERLKEVHISQDISEATVYITGPTDDTLKTEILAAMRTPFLLKALDTGMIMLHSSSVLYNEKLYCFSAPSETGKSTHAANWNRLFGVPVINGDLNLLKPINGKVCVPGTPWCGTSGICTNREYELGKVIFLKQEKKNEAVNLVPYDAGLCILSRIITPMWDAKMSSQVTDIVKSMPDTLYNVLLNCTKDGESAEVMKAYLDSENAL